MFVQVHGTMLWSIKVFIGIFGVLCLHLFYYSVTVTLMKVKGIKIKYLYYVFPNITYLNLFLEFLIRKMQNVTTLSFINTVLFPSTSTIILMFDLIQFAK